MLACRFKKLSLNIFLSISFLGKKIIISFIIMSLMDSVFTPKLIDERKKVKSQVFTLFYSTFVEIANTIMKTIHFN